MSGVGDVLEIDMCHCNAPVVTRVGWITFLEDGGQYALLKHYRDGLGRYDIVQKAN